MGIKELLGLGRPSGAPAPNVSALGEARLASEGRWSDAVSPGGPASDWLAGVVVDRTFGDSASIELRAGAVDELYLLSRDAAGARGGAAPHHNVILVDLADTRGELNLPPSASALHLGQFAVMRGTGEICSTGLNPIPADNAFWRALGVDPALCRGVDAAEREFSEAEGRLRTAVASRADRAGSAVLRDRCPELVTEGDVAAYMADPSALPGIWDRIRREALPAPSHAGLMEAVAAATSPTGRRAASSGPRP